MSLTDSESLNKKVFKEIRITSQEQMLLNCMEDFYKDSENSKKLVYLINGDISIRLIDFFVTRYSKDNRVNYELCENKKNIFNIHSSYKLQLKAWNKKYFDPFSRGDRIPFFIEDDCLITTIGQLNFFKWFISFEVIDYVKKNFECIEKEMNKNKRDNKYKKRSSPKKPTSGNKTKSMIAVKNFTTIESEKYVKIEVRFD